MTLDEMIAVLQGQKEGKPIQKRIIVGMAGGSEPTWDCMCNQHFNFHAYEYRIKPVPREWWINPTTFQVWRLPPNNPATEWIKVREVLE